MSSLEVGGPKVLPGVSLTFKCLFPILYNQFIYFSSRYLEVKEEMDEFTEGSRQLEAELEASLEQKEKLCRDLSMASQQMQKENESLYVSWIIICIRLF